MNEKRAASEGWYVAPRKHIRAHYDFFGCDRRDPSTFSAADELAPQFVKDKAAEGSAYHIEALMLIQLQ